jgi:integrase
VPTFADAYAKHRDKHLTASAWYRPAGADRMPTNTLTDAKCRALQPGDKLRKIFDGQGLHLVATPKGAKVWRVAYRLAGKPQTKSLGPYPAVSLAEARKKRDELKATLRDGGDPMAERKASKKDALTFRQASERFWSGRGDLSPSYRSNATRAMEMHLYPFLGDKPIASIDRAALLEALNRMDAAGLHQYVRKTRMWASQVFEWAVEHHEAAINPAALINPKKAFGHSKVEHFAALTLPEVPAFMQRLSLEAELQSVLACRLLALTWVRTTELRGMPWSELDGDVWRIPAARMKRKRDHIVPLSTQAQAIFAKLRARARPSCPYVFPSEHRDDRPMSENTVLALLARMGYKGRTTGHGFRSIGSTWANERGYAADAIERQLAHTPADKTRAAYNRAEFLPDRRAMLQAFADFLGAAERGAGPV